MMVEPISTPPKFEYLFCDVTWWMETFFAHLKGEDAFEVAQAMFSNVHRQCVGLYACTPACRHVRTAIAKLPISSWQFAGVTLGAKLECLEKAA